ncbi:MAG: dephospho-CoA kinase [Fimbriimonas sp.]|nr:dephospho-CoA kinase [Fimbriimonas sp.]
MLTAITGGIAEGKSTVLGYLAEMGFRTASADATGRQLFDDPAMNSVLASIAGAPYPIDRKTLRERLVADRDVRRAVNRAMHGPIMAQLRSSGAQFVEVPLLVEACLQLEFDEVWVVTCGAAEQRRRLLTRYANASHVDAILSTQLPSRVKIAFADVVIRTNQPVQRVRCRVSKAIESRLSTS